MGVKALSKVQMGQEGTPGTAVDADFVWRGPFAGIEDARTVGIVEEDLGIALPSDRAYTPQVLAKLALPATELSPEQILHVLEAGIKQVNSGVADGDSTSGYTYAYPFGTTAINDISTYTIESGDNDQVEEMEYSFVESFTITAIKGEAMMLSSNWVGRQATDASFTGGLSATATSEIQAQNGAIWLDDTGDDFGTTQLSAGNVLEATLNVTTGLVPLFTIDNDNLYFIGHYFNIDAFEMSLEIKFRYQGSAVTERDNFRNNVPRKFRLEFYGDDYSDAGTTAIFDGKKGIRLDLPGVYDSFSAVTQEDGLSVVTANLIGGYNVSDDEGLEITVANELDAVV